jgi:hypothetical protein
LPRQPHTRDLILLYMRAGGHCSFPGCSEELLSPPTTTDEAALLGYAAHIVAHADRGPRGDPSFPQSERRRYANLILLCGNHHTLVDKQPYAYTADELRGWKQEHERRVEERFPTAMQAWGFSELEQVTRAIAGEPMEPVTDFSVTPPAGKMQRNRLTARVGFWLNLGYMKTRDVEQYIGECGQEEPTFPERLKAGFLQEYWRLRHDGLDGDELFETLRAFASGGTGNLSLQAAGVAVLVYLFDKCEVFEP